MHDIVQWLDPLILGDLQAGVETIPSIQDAGELGIALVWFSGIPASQGAQVYHNTIEDMVLDTEAFGTWSFQVHLHPAKRLPDPAQARILKRDGEDIRAVAAALDPRPGIDPAHAARHAAMALMARAAAPYGAATWTWTTPLGRAITVCAQRQAD